MSIIDPPRAAKWPKGGIVIGALAAIAVTAGLFVAVPHIHFGALIPVVSEEVAPEEVAPHTHMVQVATHGINSWEEWYGHQEVYFTTPVPAYPPDQFHAKREVFFVSEGGNRLFSLLFFESEGLPAVREVFDPASGMFQVP